MVPSRLTVTGFDEDSIFFVTADGQDVFVEWRELPTGDALSHDAVRSAAQQLDAIRLAALKSGLEAIEKALAVVTEVDEQKKLQDAFDSLSAALTIPLVER